MKPLVLCADDFAFSEGVSAAVLALARAGRISATSAMVLAPRWRQDAAALRELRGRIDVGLHLDWTSDFAKTAGHGQGLGKLMLRTALGQLPAAAALTVIERQLDAFEAQWQAPPDHVDGHQHVQQFNGIRQPLVALLQRRYGAKAPWLRVSRPWAGRFDGKAQIIAAWGAQPLRVAAKSAGLPHSTYLSGIYNFDADSAAYGRRMAAWLAQVPPATLVMCHPANASDASDAISPARQAEFDFLAGDGFAQLLRASQVSLVTGRALYPAKV